MTSRPPFSVAEAPPPSELGRVAEVIQLVRQGAMVDASRQLELLAATQSPELAPVTRALVELVGRLRVDLESKETALATVQAAMWELEAAQLQIQSDEMRFRTTLASIGDGLISTDAKGAIEFMNPVAVKLTGWAVAEALGRPVAEVFRILRADTRAPQTNPVEEALSTGHTVALAKDTLLVSRDGRELRVADSCAPIRDSDDRTVGAVLVFRDVTEEHERQVAQENLEAQLRQAQKLEAVGQLAAGIAHEINTPTQFIGDSLHFLAESFESQQALLERARAELARLATETGKEERLEALRAAEDEADHDYVKEHAPAAFTRALDGIERISTIVMAMKEFAHPDKREKAPADLNRALEMSLVIARNEYKYVADVTTHFGSLPSVHCHLGDLNQVFLNLFVNAAHAIADVVGKSEQRGLITVSTEQLGREVVIRVRDTGTGIPVHVRDRIFEPFFTTKTVGKGSGQGLAIARSIVVDKHRGSLTFETELGAGTTFVIRLPVGDEAPR